MNKIERLVYDAVKSSPAVKFVLRNLYQGLFDLLPTPKNYFVGAHSVRENHFFGFHDCSPFSADESRLLAYATHIPVRMPRQEETLGIGYFDLDADGTMGEYHQIAESKAWNYHKGCRLQWLDAQHVIFNSADAAGHAISCIVGLDGTERRLHHPIDTVSADGTLATSFSYERLNIHMPGYGYEYVTDGGCLEDFAPTETGLFLMDTTTGERRMLRSLRELAAQVGLAGDATYQHYVTHSEFSPDGRYVSFLHRWIGSDYRKRHSRMVVVDLENDKQYVLPTLDMVSHYIWNRQHQIIAYCSVAEGSAHVLFDIPSCQYQPIMLGQINDDGHQSMKGDHSFVTDAYPDRRRMASLRMIDIPTQTSILLARVFSPRKFQTRDFHKHIGCDLHPRVSPSGRFVCFDTAFTGHRSLCVMKLENP